MDNDKLLFYKENANSLPVVELFTHYLEKCIDFNTYTAMDNACSMSYFLEVWLVPDCCIWKHDDTQVILQHPSFDYKIQLDSMGRGDFRSHRIKISKYIE